MSGHGGFDLSPISATPLKVVTWIGAITAVFAASIAVAQDDIKRILAYSTVSQLGYMMLGLGVGGIAVGMFHLITHAFFKALLFMGAGSVIHGCHEEQNIRRMGGLRKLMPITFATYAIGMLALCGFPLFFSGFWSKDAILHAAFNWNGSRVPFYLAAFGVLLTAFYMMRQVLYVFFGKPRFEPDATAPHESPAVMTLPLIILAGFSILLGLIGTPEWAWFSAFLNGQQLHFDIRGFEESGFLAVMLSSTALVLIGLGIGWLLYGKKPARTSEAPDAIEQFTPQVFNLLRNGWFVDAFYAATFVRFTRWLSVFCDWLDRWIFDGAVQLISSLTVGTSRLSRSTDVLVVNRLFDQSCEEAVLSGRLLSRLQGGRVQSYLRIIGIAFAGLVLFLIWGRHG